MQLLNITCATYLKARLVHSKELLDSEKYHLQVGDILDVNASLDQGDYYKIFLRTPVSGLKVWFICKEHVEITELKPDDPFAIIRYGESRAHAVNPAVDHASLKKDKRQESESHESPRYGMAGLASEWDAMRGGSAIEGEALEALQHEAIDLFEETYDVTSSDVLGASDMDVLGTYANPVPYAATTQPSPIQSAPPKSTTSTEAELKEFTPGKVLFDTPNEMRVGIRERVNVRITKTLTQDFFKGLAHSQEARIENLGRVSRFMTVVLRGDDFKITSIHRNEEQVIEEEEFTQWGWDITPLRGGKRQLIVSITIRVKVDNEQGRKDLEALEKEIDITINPIYSVKSFASQYWQWILGSALIPVGLQILSKK